MRTYTDDLIEGLSFRRSARPHIQGGHMDGPLLTFSDGQLHWLTPWERLLYLLGLTNADVIQRQRRPYLTARLQGHA